MIALKEILQSLNYTFLLLSAATPTYYGDLTKALDFFDIGVAVLMVPLIGCGS
mgnify:CR=1 FL=1